MFLKTFICHMSLAFLKTFKDVLWNVLIVENVGRWRSRGRYYSIWYVSTWKMLTPQGPSTLQVTKDDVNSPSRASARCLLKHLARQCLVPVTPKSYVSLLSSLISYWNEDGWSSQFQQYYHTAERRVVLKSLIQLPNSLWSIERLQNNITFWDNFCLQKIIFWTNVLNEASTITGRALILFSGGGGINGTIDRLINLNELSIFLRFTSWKDK